MTTRQNNMRALVKALQSFNTSRDIHTVGKYDLPPEYPITFYDRHIDSSLSLKRVEIIPSMPHLFLNLCDEKVRAFAATTPTYYDPIRHIPGFRQPLEFWSSEDVAKAYEYNLVNCCHPFPSKLYLHPERKDWNSVFSFGITRMSRYRPTFLTEAFLRVHNGYVDPHDPFSPNHLVDESALSKLIELYAHSPLLATWDFYPMTLSGGKIINTMSNVPQFIWEVSRTTTGQYETPPCSHHFPDSQGRFLAALLSRRKAPNARTRKSPTNDKGNAPSKVLKKMKKVTPVVIPSISRRPGRTGRPYRVDPMHFLQHAWARAVANDSTFIVFNCGKYERIGVRHRASQTLYLSEPIDPTTCRVPTYGMLHVGLHFAIIEDSLERQQLRSDSLPPVGADGRPTRKRKRASDPKLPDNPISPKRQKLEPERALKIVDGGDGDRHIQAISAALSTRDLALVSLNYGVFRSPAPSSFMRRGPSCAPGFHRESDSFTPPDQRANYLPHQYFSLALSEPIEKGATGTVHRASAEVYLESGETLKHPLIVKFVFLDRDTRIDEDDEPATKTEEDRVIHEYSVYQHLASAGVVDGILPVYGLFEDIDSGTLALIMEDGGTSLKHRQFEETGDVAVVTVLSKPQQNFLVHALECVHKSGVCHGDIRTENILVNSKDEMFFIDFDRAVYVKYPSRTCAHELSCMRDMVDGTAGTI